MPFSVAISEEEKYDKEEGEDTRSCAYSDCDDGVLFKSLTNRGCTRR